MIWVALALAGGLGALVRARVALVLAGRPHGRPVATATVNLTGSLALGLLVGAAGPTSAAVFVLGTGFLGGLTTFSTWIMGAGVAEGTRAPALIVLGQLVLGPALAGLGLWLAGA